MTPPNNIERIEIYRGGSPGRASESSPAGAIFLNTFKKPEDLRVNFSNSYGSVDSYKGSLQIEYPFKKTWYGFSLTHSQSDGSFTFKDNNGTWTNTADDTIKKRWNNDHLSENLLLKFGWNPNERWSLEASNTTLIKRQGIPGLGSLQSENARLNTDRNITIFNLGYGELKFTTFFDYINSRFLDPNGEIGLGRQRNDDYIYRFGEETSYLFDIGPFNTVFVSLAYRGEYFEPNNYAATVSNGDLSSRHQVGAVAEDTISVLNERLTIIPSVRFTTLFNHLSGSDPSIQTGSTSINKKNDYQITGKLGTKFRIIKDLFANGNFYRGFRNPNFDELFGDRGTLVGNAKLKPEESINFDVGLLYNGPVRLEAVYFRSYTDNLIQFLQTSQFTAKPQNLSKSTIQGVESSAQVNYLDHFSHTLYYTYQQAKDSSNTATKGKYLPGRPQHEMWFESSAYNKWGKIYGEYNFMSGNFLDSQNIMEITGRHILNFGITATPTKWLLINTTVKNITGNRTFDMIGFPLPGRSYWGAITLKI